MSGRTSIGRAACLAALVAALAACGRPGGGAGEDPAAAEPRVVRMINTPFLAQAPYFIALEEGLFEEAGVRVEAGRQQLGRTTQEIIALGRGDADVASTRLTVGLLNAIARGAPIRIAAARGALLPGECSTFALVVRPGLVPEALDGPEALADLRLQMGAGAVEEFLVDRVLAPHGLRSSDLAPARVPLPARLEALAQGRIDLTAEHEPWLTRQVRRGATVWLPFEEVAPGLDYSYVLFGPALHGASAELGARFLRAYLRAVEIYAEGKTDRNVETIARWTDLDEELLREACWPRFRPAGELDWERLAEFQRWAFERGYLERVLEPEELWDPRPLARAREVDAAGGSARRREP